MINRARSHAPGGKLSVGLKVQICGQLGSGLMYLHKKGLVHCDVKPANFLVSEGRAFTLEQLPRGLENIANS